MLFNCGEQSQTLAHTVCAAPGFPLHNSEHKIMQVLKLVPVLTLCLAGSLAKADNVNCSSLTNPQARQECAQHKTAANADCSAISDQQARKECAERKQQNTVDCSKLATAEARQQCARQKAK
jgi:hypothetical protein